MFLRKILIHRRDNPNHVLIKYKNSRRSQSLRRVNNDHFLYIFFSPRSHSLFPSASWPSKRKKSYRAKSRNYEDRKKKKTKTKKYLSRPRVPNSRVIHKQNIQRWCLWFQVQVQLVQTKVQNVTTLLFTSLEFRSFPADHSVILKYSFYFLKKTLVLLIK